VAVLAEQVTDLPSETDRATDWTAAEVGGRRNLKHSLVTVMVGLKVVLMQEYSMHLRYSLVLLFVAVTVGLKRA
jgi:hypothetical protein